MEIEIKKQRMESGGRERELNPFRFKFTYIPGVMLTCAIPPPDTLFGFAPCSEIQVVESQGKYLAMVKEKAERSALIIFWLESRQVVVAFKLATGSDLFLFSDKIMIPIRTHFCIISFSGKELYRVDRKDRPGRELSLSPTCNKLLSWDRDDGKFFIFDTKDWSCEKEGFDVALVKCDWIQWVSDHSCINTTPWRLQTGKPLYVNAFNTRYVCMLKSEWVDSSSYESSNIQRHLYANNLGTWELLYDNVNTVQFLPGSNTHGIILMRNGTFVVEMLRDFMSREKRLLLMFARTRDEESHIYNLALDIFKIILKYARLIR